MSESENRRMKHDPSPGRNDEDYQILPEFTDDLREILRHSLGLHRSSEAYRNYFDAVESDIFLCEQLVELGYMRLGEHSANRRVYHVTDMGRIAASRKESTDE